METTNYEQVKEQALFLPLAAQQTLRSALTLPADEQRQLLAELPAHLPVRVRRVPARDFTLELRWLRENRHLYPGEYLAVSGSQLLAHGTEPRAVLAAARASGQDFLLDHPPREDELPYGGGLW